VYAKCQDINYLRPGGGQNTLRLQTDPMTVDSKSQRACQLAQRSIQRQQHKGADRQRSLSITESRRMSKLQMDTTMVDGRWTMETVPHKKQKAKVRLSGKCDKDPGQLSNAKRTTTRKTPTKIPIQIQVETQPKTLINLWPIVSAQIQIQVQLQLQVQVQVYCVLFSFSFLVFGLE